MYVGNNHIRTNNFRKLVAATLSTGILAVAVYAVRNYDRLASWTLDISYNAAIADRQESTKEMLQTVNGRVPTMNSQELRQAAEQCEALHENIVMHYVEQLEDLEERKYMNGQRQAVRRVLQSIESKLEEE